MAEGDEEAEAVPVTWSPIYVTLLVSFAQGVVFFLFFLRRRKKDARVDSYQLYETRQFSRAQRSPPPFGGAGALGGSGKDEATDVKGYGLGVFGWARAAYKLSHPETLRCVGLDSYMYLRFLRVGFRASVVGSLLAVCILIPLYRTGEARGVETEQFNSITLARVEAGSPRLYGTVLCWYVFVAFLLRELWTEWREFATHRYQYLAHGDVDTPKDYRYAILVENVPKSLRSSHAVADYFDHLFPGKVRQATVCHDTTKLDELVADRHKVLLGLEKAEAFRMAKPDKPPSKVRPIGKKCGPKVDAATYYAQRLEELNAEIDEERGKLHAFSDGRSSVHESKTDFIRSMLGSSGGNGGGDGAAAAAEGEVSASADAASPTAQDEEDAFELSLVDGGGGTSSVSVAVPPTSSETARTEGEFREEEENDDDDDDGDLPLDGSSDDARRRMTSTAFVTFTSLRAKQSAAQCEISGSYVKMNAFPAPEPSGVLWNNVTSPLKKQRRHQVQAAAFLSVGVLFWALPVSFVTAWSNLNSILVAVGAGEVNPNAFWYGLVSGLLPVIALQVLMIVLYIVIVSAASKFVRYKSMTQVDAYALFWHQWYQFANLWLILIGGSAFNQIDSLINDPTSIVSVIATAMPGASVFFINMISVSSFGAFGLQLSMIPSYAVRMILGLIMPEAGRTQRQLDLDKKPPSLQWGKQLPPLVFIFLVAVMYMPIVPVVELFAMGYFGGSYLVWKHQCLHVYAQEFEGGGTATWLGLFGFVMGCLYMAQAVFIAYMGIKEGVAQFVMGFVPLVVTIVVHKLLNRNVIRPLRNLSLEVAADIDVEEGELKSSRDDWAKSATAVERQLFGQPCLKASLDERSPMPYRRDDAATATAEDVETGVAYLS